MTSILALSSILPNPRNPRKTFLQIAELGETIREHGLIQPITVRPHPEQSDFYQIVVGERRFRAHQYIGASTIECNIRELSDHDVAAIMLIENIDRHDLSPAEESRYVAEAVANGWTVRELSERLGKSAKWVAIRLQISQMSETILGLLDSGKIGVAHVHALATIQDLDAREDLAERIAADHLTIQDTADIISNMHRDIATAKFPTCQQFDHAPACSNCPNRSDLQGELFDSAGKSLCLDPNCWDRKHEEFRSILIETEQERGAVVVPDSQAFQAMNGLGRYTTDPKEIESLQKAGAVPSVLINQDCERVEVWAKSPVRKDTPAVGNTDKERLKEECTRLMREIILKRIMDDNQTLFFDFIADAILGSSDHGVDVLHAVSKGKEIRFSEKRKLIDIREGLCRWAVMNLDLGEKDARLFSIPWGKVIKKSKSNLGIKK